MPWTLNQRPEANHLSRGSRATPILFAVASAALFGMGTPFAKLLVDDIPPVALAGLFYIGAFLGLAVYGAIRSAAGHKTVKSEKLQKADLRWLAGAVVTGGIIAPICLMLGLTKISGYSASLLLNLEGVMTAIVAAAFFKESLGRTFAFALMAMTGAGVILSWDPTSGSFNILGPLLLAGAALAWGLDNNFTRNICAKDPVRIAQIKGGAAGSASLIIAFLLSQSYAVDMRLLLALVIGAAGYGASLVFFILALQGLGAARTGAFFSLGPFVGAAISLPLLGERLGWFMLAAAVLMAAGAWMILREQHVHVHRHVALTHSHMHTHGGGPHDHSHEKVPLLPHDHEHTHPETVHAHAHWPDLHHRHGHGE